jgi:hypothetical protein
MRCQSYAAVSAAAAVAAALTNHRPCTCRARSSSPAIIFFDELDGMVGGRDEGGTSDGVDVGARVLSQMLQEMDGLQVRHCTPLLLVLCCPKFLIILSRYLWGADAGPATGDCHRRDEPP